MGRWVANGNRASGNEQVGIPLDNIICNADRSSYNSPRPYSDNVIKLPKRALAEYFHRDSYNEGLQMTRQ